MLSAVNLAWFHLKRLSRHRAAVGALIAAPAAAGAFRALLPGWQVSVTAARACPWVCAAAAGAALYVQHRLDEDRGLLDVLRGAPIPRSAPTVSRLIAGAALFGAQMIAFAGVLALRSV